MAPLYPAGQTGSIPPTATKTDKRNVWRSCETYKTCVVSWAVGEGTPLADVEWWVPAGSGSWSGRGGGSVADGVRGTETTGKGEERGFGEAVPG